MGTWGAGPFDSDATSDWAIDLRDSSPAERVAMVRSALALEEGYLDADDGQTAVAAAAVVAVAAGTLEGPVRLPDFLAGRPSLDLPGDLRDLALAALDRVTAQDSELQDLWTENGPNEDWDAQIALLRASLQR